jgi:hypothetical protein
MQMWHRASEGKMKVYQQLLNTVKQLLPWLNDLIENQKLSIARNEDGIVFDINHGDPVLKNMSETGTLQLIQTYLCMELIKQGPKLIDLDQSYVAPLINTDININVRDYSQPYELMLVNLPNNFIEKYETDGEELDSTAIKHSPGLVMVLHNRELNSIAANVCFTSGHIYSIMIFKDETLEESLHTMLTTLTPDSETVNKEETQSAVLALRIALNTLLLADSGKLKCKGPHNPDYFAKLDKLIAKSNTPQKRDANIAEKKLHPIIYEIDQTIKLNEYTHNQSDSETGKSVKPHWRRGHYRMQAIGEGHQERKRVRIAPILVK